MVIWVVVNVPFFQWPIVRELHKHKTAGAAAAHAIASKRSGTGCSYTACVPIENGSCVVDELAKLYRKTPFDKELEGVILYPWIGEE